LAQDTIRDYIIQGNKDIINPKIRWEKHLSPVFAYSKAAEVTRPMIDKYVAARLKAGATNSSVNRELAFLKHAFRLGLEHEKVYRVPTFPHLTEDNVREGFPTDAQFDKLKAACSKEALWLRAMLELAATFGWRKRSLLVMRVANVDLLNNTIRQEGSTTKSGEGNEVKMTPDLRALIAACASGKDSDRFLFSHDDLGVRPIVDFRISWATVTEAAGVPHLHFHDLCRKAARDLDAAGISQAVGMQVMGRRTPSIYRRYRIVDRRDIDRAIDRLVDHRKTQQKTDGEIDSQIDSQSKAATA
jgi:integrase